MTYKFQSVSRDGRYHVVITEEGGDSTLKVLEIGHGSILTITGIDHENIYDIRLGLTKTGFDRIAIVYYENQNHYITQICTYIYSDDGGGVMETHTLDLSTRNIPTQSYDFTDDLRTFVVITNERCTVFSGDDYTEIDTIEHESDNNGYIFGETVQISRGAITTTNQDNEITDLIVSRTSALKTEILIYRKDSHFNNGFELLRTPEISSSSSFTYSGFGQGLHLNGTDLYVGKIPDSRKQSFTTSIYDTTNLGKGPITSISTDLYTGSSISEDPDGIDVLAIAPRFLYGSTDRLLVTLRYKQEQGIFPHVTYLYERGDDDNYHLKTRWKDMKVTSASQDLLLFVGKDTAGCYQLIDLAIPYRDLIMQETNIQNLSMDIDTDTLKALYLAIQNPPITNNFSNDINHFLEIVSTLDLSLTMKDHATMIEYILHTRYDVDSMDTTWTTTGVVLQKMLGDAWGVLEGDFVVSINTNTLEDSVALLKSIYTNYLTSKGWTGQQTRDDFTTVLTVESTPTTSNFSTDVNDALSAAATTVDHFALIQYVLKWRLKQVTSGPVVWKTTSIWLVQLLNDATNYPATLFREKVVVTISQDGQTLISDPAVLLDNVYTAYLAEVGFTVDTTNTTKEVLYRTLLAVDAAVAAIEKHVDTDFSANVNSILGSDTVAGHVTGPLIKHTLKTGLTHIASESAVWETTTSTLQQMLPDGYQIPETLERDTIQVTVTQPPENTITIAENSSPVIYIPSIVEETTINVGGSTTIKIRENVDSGHYQVQVLPSNEWVISTGDSYTHVTGNWRLSIIWGPAIILSEPYYNDSACAGADPYVFPCLGPAVKLPNVPAMYRLYQDSTVIINARVAPASTVAREQIAAAACALVDSELFVPVTAEAFFFSELYIATVDQQHHVHADLVHKKIQSMTSFFTVGAPFVDTSPQRAYETINNDTMSRVSVCIQWPGMSTTLTFSRNPQVRNGLSLTGIYSAHSTGLLVRNYRPKLFTLPRLTDTRPVVLHPRHRRTTTQRGVTGHREAIILCR
jgi:hypothetical protein